MFVNKMFVGRSLFFSFIFAVFFITSSGLVINAAKTCSHLPRTSGTATVLSADGTDPMPRPTPWGGVAV
jgi:hypothetical protein